MQNRTVELAVGIFVALGMAALFMLAMRVSNLTLVAGKEGYPLKARFESIGGLKVRAPVTLAGVGIGRVKAIDLDNTTYQAIVTMTIESPKLKLPSDTSASIYTAGLLGENYVSLEPGGEETWLKPGAEIKLTQPAFVLERMIGQFLFNRPQQANGAGEKPGNLPPGPPGEKK
jgi:phospholipid/cholesterol/gamma-HCH transport system substrate-binding protein